ncbi:hypothetical protein BAUCODRAFT_577105 [Baudoinia panamericana UAMH 10762]|uniref:Amino acid permease/ SLC12A domain-containing protein n=1 Tax=Baudoinia panamericana (strain UAMH 10762) TaxID=717646 RepID=M2N9N6_BAUPA|nr:uncharacterized protein BAUCODRAFT_577105 [Baudoinia panamericana UAMH 10762]EMC95839.1 hypothetical protein BAUCODRAFT_577105 [Baudoinia panamericana UAMH 10762]
MFAVILVVCFVNCIGTRLLALVEGVIMVLRLFAFLAILIPMVSRAMCTAIRSHGRDVFATLTNNAGWISDGSSWFIGFARSANLAVIGHDGPAHLAEEVQNARTVVPWCMISTVILNGTLGCAIVIAFSFCVVPTIEDTLTSPTSYHFMEVFYGAMGSAGTAGMTAVLIVLM